MEERAWVHIEFVKILKMTDFAFLVKFAGHAKAQWIPLSQIEENGKHYTEGDQNGSMCITEWIAKEKGLV